MEKYDKNFNIDTSRYSKYGTYIKKSRKLCDKCNIYDKNKINKFKKYFISQKDETKIYKRTNSRENNLVMKIYNDIGNSDEVTEQICEMLNEGIIKIKEFED